MTNAQARANQSERENGTRVLGEYTPAFFGLLANRLINHVVETGASVAVEQQIGAPVRAMSTLLLLREGPLTVTELATRLGVSHPGAIKITRDLISRGLLRRSVDPSDVRRRPLALTDEGEVAVRRTQEFVMNAQTVYRELFEEIGVDVHAALTAMEDALSRRSFGARLKAAYTARRMPE